ncbi:hypothetical protein CDL12_22265 [Handroanthus impetiginosus]|uniref:Uncharacterized protein n=1 Tax=Handroanthus impetiginosus TaxID=429701 RepID=A0A2G9GIU5_9LAMI|nr:hypothetical protein CDL12_22265 [Handroanthus impetiginosus]
MVLSNKKLKQKLRAAKAELMAASEAENNLNSGNLDSKSAYSLRTTLNPEAQKPRISKREKRRQKAKKENAEISKSRETSNDAEGKKQDGLKSDAVEMKKKKRKRDESKASENVKEKRSEELKKKKNPRKKKKPKKEVGNEKVKEEGVKQNESGATGEQLSANTDESIDSVPDLGADALGFGALQVAMILGYNE